MQKIGLLELANHNEVLRAYILILLESEKVKTVEIFTNKWNFNQVYDFQDNPRINWHIIENVSELLEYELIIKELSVLIQTTIEDESAKVVELNIACKLAIVIHNAHCQFQPFKNIVLNTHPIEFVKDIGRLLKFILIKRPALKRAEEKADILFFPIKNALTKNKKSTKRMLCLPFSVNEEVSYIAFHENIFITIPGIISDKSRDYEVVIEALKKIKNHNIKLTLLGKPKGKYGLQIINKFKKINSLELVCYTSFIPQEIYDKKMRETDFLILPMKEKMSFGVITEKNGYSTTSGNINDMVRYGIPALLPAFYPLNNSLKSVVGQFQNANELTTLIDHWAEGKVYNKIKIENMKEAMKPFDRKELAIIVNELI
ncbi:hypothetical protein [Portibacter lacus]|uniref:Uncharacterized protein n=1 Tax=Portibacter lacus TaxID=1099794 RepID=A0AA37SRA8_9BACT|nr:hypothetical protein [Portibacter lacus]GLR18707.1 hypothetical protein GCM10007940_33230 [Portibacter lacus]